MESTLVQDAGSPAPVERLDKLKVQLRAERDARVALTSQLADVEAERAHDLAGLAQAVGIMRQKQAELETLLDSQRKKNKEFKSNARREKIELKRQLATVRSEHESMRGALQLRGSEAEQLQQEIAAKSATIDSLENLVNQRELELAEATATVGLETTRGKAKLQTMVSQIQELRGAFTKLLHDSQAEIQAAAAANSCDYLSIASQFGSLALEHADLRGRFIAESKERRLLYNKVLELKGNIRVFCRCRPLKESEIQAGHSSTVDMENLRDGGELLMRTGAGVKKVFKFDRVFGPEVRQAAVFEDTAPVVTSVLDGYNVCIFAYGQTGTGKTYTMEGPSTDRGVNFRTLEELFRVATEREKEMTYRLSVSVMEIYNEQVRDLLAPPPVLGQQQKRLEIKQCPEGGHHVPGLIEEDVQSMDAVWEVLKAGSRNRSTGATNSNEHSSRSHCLLCVMVRGDNHVTGECTRSKLWLVDLAGSERVGKSEATGERLKEAQAINKSLSALGDVIFALMTKTPHVPYRNSKLTHLLQDSLGGDSKTLMFVQISPSESDAGETLCSLSFAARVRGVELGPAKKQQDVGELARVRALAEKLKVEAKQKEDNVRRLDESLKVTESKLTAKEQLCQTLSDKAKEASRGIQELEQQLAGEREARAAAEVELARRQRILEVQLAEERRARAAADAHLAEQRSGAARAAVEGREAKREAEHAAASTAMTAAAAPGPLLPGPGGVSAVSAGSVSAGQVATFLASAPSATEVPKDRAREADLLPISEEGRSHPPPDPPGACPAGPAKPELPAGGAPAGPASGRHLFSAPITSPASAAKRLGGAHLHGNPFAPKIAAVGGTPVLPPFTSTAHRSTAPPLAAWPMPRLSHGPLPSTTQDAINGRDRGSLMGGLRPFASLASASQGSSLRSEPDSGGAENRWVGGQVAAYDDATSAMRPAAGVTPQTWRHSSIHRPPLSGLKQNRAADYAERFEEYKKRRAETAHETSASGLSAPSPHARPLPSVHLDGVIAGAGMTMGVGTVPGSATKVRVAGRPVAKPSSGAQRVKTSGSRAKAASVAPPPRPFSVVEVRERLWQGR